MGIPSSAAAVASDALVASLADPHLLVLGLLIFGWIVDGILAAIEQLRRSDTADSPVRPARRGDPDALADDGSHSSSVE